MNKREFIKQLSDHLSYTEEQCMVINEILESNFFISKKNKDKIIGDFIQRLEIDVDEANHIYDVAIKIINDEIKNKFKHPFKNQDK